MCNIFVQEGENLTDEELVALINSGRYEFFSFLINRYNNKISYSVSKYSSFLDADDLLQEGRLALFIAAKSYDSDKSSFNTFASLCIERTMLAQLKAGGAKKRIPDKLISPLEEQDITDNSNPEQLFIDKESYISFTKRAKSLLSKKEYSVFCEFITGKSYSEIADSLNISQKSVDNSLRRIREKLKV